MNPAGVNFGRFNINPPHTPRHRILRWLWARGSDLGHRVSSAWVEPLGSLPFGLSVSPHRPRPGARPVSSIRSAQPLSFMGGGWSHPPTPGPRSLRDPRLGPVVERSRRLMKSNQGAPFLGCDSSVKCRSVLRVCPSDPAKIDSLLQRWQPRSVGFAGEGVRGGAVECDPIGATHRRSEAVVLRRTSAGSSVAT